MLRVDCSMAHFLVFCREFGISVRKTDDCNQLWQSVIIELSISDSKSPIHRKEWIYMFENFKFRIFVKYFLILSGFLLIPFFTLFFSSAESSIIWVPLESADFLAASSYSPHNFRS